MSDRSPLEDEQSSERPDSDSITFVRDPVSGTARTLAPLAPPRVDPRASPRARPAIEMKTIIGTPPAPGAVAIRHIRQVAESEERAHRSAPTVPTQQMPGEIPIPGTLGSTMIGMPASASLPVTRRITVPHESKHGITTRELSAHELAHELEVARLLDQLTESAFETPVPSSSVERPSTRPARAQFGSHADAGASLHVTQEMSLDELVPPSHVQLPALGQAARGPARAVHTDATPTVIASTAELFPPATREALQASEVEVFNGRYEGPAPSVAPRPTPVERPKRSSGLLIAGTVAAVLLLGLSVYAKRPNAPGVATVRRAVAALLGRADGSRRAPRPPVAGKVAAVPVVASMLPGAPAAPDAPEAAPLAAAPNVAPAPAEAVLVQAAPVPAAPDVTAAPTEAAAAAPTGEAAVQPTAAPVERSEEENDKQALFAQPQRAAELYVEGRFKEALAEYRMLATFHPEQPIYADFARILRRRLVETCVRTQPHRQTECNQL